MITEILISFVILFLGIWVWKRWQRQQILRRMGIPGPAPSFLFGNYATIISQGFHVAIKNWHNQYGKVFGVYHGDEPVIVTADPDMCEEILVKQFHKFPDRQYFILNSKCSEYKSMVESSYDDWKRLRAVASPAFTNKRMREMIPLMKKSITSLIEVLSEKCIERKSFDIQKNLQSLTLEVIASTAFGLDTNTVKDTNSVFMHRFQSTMLFIENKNFIFNFGMVFFMMFPNLLHFLRRIFYSDIMIWPHKFFRKLAREVILDRKSSKKDRPDFIQLLLKAQEKSDDEQVDEASQRATLKMSLPEMIEQSYVFLLAGYETTSSALTFILHELVMHPHVQDKLREEVDQLLLQDEKEIEYSLLHHLPYMEMVINETLRLHAIAPIAQTRQCMEDTDVLGMRIPRGVCIQINARDIQESRDVWGDDVMEFKPERFVPENKKNIHPMAWLPFGQGPRACIGMRFAYLEMKHTLVNILQNFIVKSSPETKIPIPVNTQILRSPSEGLFVILERRQK